jgi:hypothetical protein
VPQSPERSAVDDSIAVSLKLGAVIEGPAFVLDGVRPDGLGGALGVRRQFLVFGPFEPTDLRLRNVVSS